MLLAAAIAARTFAFSSSDINRPATPAAADTGFGSSALIVGLALRLDTVVDNVEASAVSNPSGVTNRVFADSRSFERKGLDMIELQYET